MHTNLHVSGGLAVFLPPPTAPEHKVYDSSLTWLSLSAPYQLQLSSAHPPPKHHTYSQLSKHNSGAYPA